MYLFLCCVKLCVCSSQFYLLLLQLENGEVGLDSIFVTNIIGQNIIGKLATVQGYDGDVGKVGKVE